MSKIFITMAVLALTAVQPAAENRHPSSVPFVPTGVPSDTPWCEGDGAIEFRTTTPYEEGSVDECWTYV